MDVMCTPIHDEECHSDFKLIIFRLVKKEPEEESGKASIVQDKSYIL